MAGATAGAIIASSLISAGTSAAIADQQRKTSNRARDKAQRLADQRQQKEQQAAFQRQQQQQQLSQNRSRVAQAAVDQAQSRALRSRGIAPIGRDLSAAVLNDASQN